MCTEWRLLYSCGHKFRCQHRCVPVLADRPCEGAQHATPFDVTIPCPECVDRRKSDSIKKKFTVEERREMQAQLAHILPEQKKLFESMRKFRQELAGTALPSVPVWRHQVSSSDSGNGITSGVGTGGGRSTRARAGSFNEGYLEPQAIEDD